MPDVLTLMRTRLRVSGSRPFVTFVDDDVRTELSAASLENAAAKIANALRDDRDLDAGARIALRIGPHWQRTAWSAGALVAGMVVDASGRDAPVDHAALVVTTADRAGDLTTVADVGVVSTHPLGLPDAATTPTGAVDLTLAVRQQPDAYLYEPPEARFPAWVLAGRVLTQAELVDLAEERGRAWSLERGGRLLVPADCADADAWLAAFAVPLALDASVVLTTTATDTARVAQSERVTATIDGSP